jgi:tetratricopeptide (TPR) repeat protein
MRIFVSSTSEDLRDFRTAVVRKLSALDHDVVSMDGYSADSRGPLNKVLEDVASADLYIGLFAYRYGWVPPECDQSVTEMEFREAGARGVPRLIFVVPNDAVWPMNLLEPGETYARMMRFRTSLLTATNFSVAYFRDKEELVDKVLQAITDNLRHRLRKTARTPASRDSFRATVKPLSFEAEKSKHLARFTGREWVEAKLDEWIARRRDSRVFCLLGGPGIGKSAIACHWCYSRKDVIAFHYCVHGHTERTDPKRIFLSLAAQIAAKLPEFNRRLSALSVTEVKEIAAGDAQGVFENFLLKPLTGGFPPPDRVRLVVIDGLDEASRGADNDLATFLGEVWAGLPDWLQLVVTSRQEMDVSAFLSHLHPYILDASSRENLQDIRAFLQRELAGQQASDRAVNEIVEKSEGMFLYACLVLDEIRSGQLSLQQTAEFPQGLSGYYTGWFTRKFPDVEVYQRDLHELVSVVIAQRAPLPETVISGALGLTSHAVSQRLMRLCVLFPLRKDGQGDEMAACVTLMHKSLQDWLTGRRPIDLQPWAGSFQADPERGNLLLAEEGWRVYRAGKLPHHPYFSKTILSHLSQAQQPERLAAVLLDPTLVETLWSNEMRYEWQLHISSVRHSLSLADLVQQWLRTHGSVPDVRTASVAAKLCRLFQEMGAPDQAVLLAEAALKIWQANNVSDSPDMVGLLLALGRIHSVHDRIECAMKSYEKALAIARKAYLEDSPQMAEVLYALCVFYTQGKRDYTKASEYLEKCLAIYRRGNPPDGAAIATCVNDRAIILSAEGRSADYLGIYREALDLFEKARPDGDPEMVATLGNIASALCSEGKNAEALEVLRRGVAMADRVVLPGHEHSSFVRISLASTLLAMGKHDEALAGMRHYVAEVERFSGPVHDETAAARLLLCQTLVRAVLVDDLKRGDYREEILRQCHQIHQAAPATVLGLLSLAEDAHRQGEPDVCELLRETARRACRGAAERPHKNAADAVTARCFFDALGVLLLDQPLAELAPRVFDVWTRYAPQMEDEADCLPKTRKLILASISWTGRTRLDRNGDIESVRHAFDLVTQIGAEVPETLDNLASLTMSLHQRRHDEVSESLCQRLLEKSEAILGPEHVETLGHLESLGLLRMCRGNFEDAERFFRRAFQSRLSSGGTEQANTIVAITKLAECLLLQGSDRAAWELIREFAAKLPADEAFSSARKTLGRTLTTAGMQLKNEFAAFHASRIAYELALEIDPNNATAHNNMAMLLWGCLGEPGGAADHFRHSVRLNPTDGNTLSNYAHLLAQTLNNPEQALVHFEEALPLSPNVGGILGNYAALLIRTGDLARAWNHAERARRLCMPNPDRTIVRSFFCAAAILLLNKRDAVIPLGQIKALFAHGIDHVPWVLTATLQELDRRLSGESAQLMRAIAEAINDRTRVAALEDYSAWRAAQPAAFDERWPDMQCPGEPKWSLTAG